MANSLEVVGVLYKKMDTQRVTDKLDKRDFVIETTDDQYPQLIKFELMNEKTLLIDRLNVGEKVKVSFNLRGREWKKDESNTVYFNSLQAWRVELIGTSPATAAQSSKQSAPVATTDDGGDLPF